MREDSASNAVTLPTSALAAALAYARIGWHVLPLEPRSKQPLGRLVPNGQNDATTDPDTLARWFKLNPNAGVGIYLQPSGLVAVDIDPRNGGLMTMETIEAEHGELASDVMAFTGGGGEHRVFALPAGMAGALPGKLGPGVDLKANGYIAVFPTVHPNGRQYVWEASSDPLEGAAPTPLPDWLRSFVRPASAPTGQETFVPIGGAQWAELGSALTAIAADERDTWVAIGQALHSTGELDRAFKLWDTWSQTSTKYDPRDTLRVWRSFKPRGLAGTTYRRVFAMARDAGWRTPRVAAVNGVTAAAPASDLPIVFSEDIRADGIKLTQIVEDVLTEGGLSVIFGESNSGKTFLSVHLSCCVSRGSVWLGKRTERRAVLYVAGEGCESIKLRVLAYRQQFRATDTALAVVPVAINMFDSRADTARVVEASRRVAEHYGLQVGLVVIDTLARVMGGGNENAGEDVGIVVENADRIRQETGAAVLFVHHSGKDASKGARGWSGLRGAVDTEIEVIGDDETHLHTAKITKQRDLGSKGQEITGKFSAVSMGIGQWGKPITTCVVFDTNEPPVTRTALKGGRGISQDVIAVLEAGGPSMKRAAIADALADKHSRSAVYNALARLLKQQLVGAFGESVSLNAPTVSAQFSSKRIT